MQIGDDYNAFVIASNCYSKSVKFNVVKWYSLLSIAEKSLLNCLSK